MPVGLQAACPLSPSPSLRQATGVLRHPKKCNSRCFVSEAKKGVDPIHLFQTACVPRRSFLPVTRCTRYVHMIWRGRRNARTQPRMTAGSPFCCSALERVINGEDEYDSHPPLLRSSHPSHPDLYSTFSATLVPKVKKWLDRSTHLDLQVVARIPVNAITSSATHVFRLRCHLGTFSVHGSQAHGFYAPDHLTICMFCSRTVAPNLLVDPIRPPRC